MGKNKYIIWLWSLVWRRSLQPTDKVIKVKGWRTGLIDTKWGQRSTVQFIMPWEKD